MSDSQIALANGYDHNFVLNHPGDLSVPAAVCCCPSTGIVLTVHTDQPGIQVYSANNLDGSLTGKGGVPLATQTGLCLETQHFPDSPNHPDFPSTVLRPGEPFASTTVFAFSVAE
jgi:aldose 1-epimerase